VNATNSIRKKKLTGKKKMVERKRKQNTIEKSTIDVAILSKISNNGN